MARLYSNENFPVQVVVTLRGLGHDVLTSLEAGQANQAISDDRVLAYATGLGRTLLTINRRDFVREHQRQPGYAGLIVCSQDPDVAGQAHRIDQTITANAPLAGKLLLVNRPPD